MRKKFLRECAVFASVFAGIAVVGMLIAGGDAEKTEKDMALDARILAKAKLPLDNETAALVCLNGRTFAVATGKNGSVAITPLFRGNRNGMPERCGGTE